MMIVVAHVYTHLSGIIFTANGCAIGKSNVTVLSCTVAYFTMDVNPRFAKPPLKVIGGLDKLKSISQVK